MADKTVALEATDLFSLGGNFNPQSSSTDNNRARANILDAVGNNQCETMINDKTDYTNPYAYCNAIPDIKADLATFLTQFGNVQNSKLITQIVINFVGGAYATLDITGHNHTDNAHAAGLTIGYADVSGACPAGAGFGVPDFGLTLGADATPTRATLTFSMNHIDREDTNGDHWVGKNITPTVELSMELEGIPTSVTYAALETDLGAGWSVDSFGPSDGNQAFDTYALNAHIFYDLATV